MFTIIYLKFIICDNKYYCQQKFHKNYASNSKLIETLTDIHKNNITSDSDSD